METVKKAFTLFRSQNQDPMLGSHNYRVSFPGSQNKNLTLFLPCPSMGQANGIKKPPGLIHPAASQFRPAFTQRTGQRDGRQNGDIDFESDRQPRSIARLSHAKREAWSTDQDKKRQIRGFIGSSTIRRISSRTKKRCRRATRSRRALTAEAASATCWFAGPSTSPADRPVQ